MQFGIPYRRHQCSCAPRKGSVSRKLISQHKLERGDHYGKDLSASAAPSALHPHLRFPEHAYRRQVEMNHGMPIAMLGTFRYPHHTVLVKQVKKVKQVKVKVISLSVAKYPSIESACIIRTFFHRPNDLQTRRTGPDGVGLDRARCNLRPQSLRGPVLAKRVLLGKVRQATPLLSPVEDVQNPPNPNLVNV